MNNFTDTLINEYDNEFLNQWVELNIEPWRFNWLAAQKWTCPTNEETRKALPEDKWQKCKELFIKSGKKVIVDKKAELISTSYHNGNKSYLVWLSFIGPDGNKYKMDVWIKELDSKQNKNAEKHIDPRSPSCQDILASILKTSSIPVNIAKLLPTMGAKNWTGTVEKKVQMKLNSYIQAIIFEKACDKVGVKYKQLDIFDNYLYRGDPGCLADYDLTFSNGTTVRIDLKLIQKPTVLAEQNPHDAELLISSDWHTADIQYHRVFGEPEIENTDEFKELLKAFEDYQKTAGKCFIHINDINLNTGKVNFIEFGYSS